MADLAEIKSLLAKVEAIGVKYSGIAEREQYGFNVFSILRNSDEEVGMNRANFDDFIFSHEKLFRETVCMISCA